MSSYIQTAINPVTKKSQQAIYYDDFYGHHRYGVGFNKDGSDFKIQDGIDIEKMVFYPLEYVENAVG